jgi:hypothetical protein
MHNNWHVRLPCWFWLLCCGVPVACADEMTSTGRTAVVTELDAYYSNIGLYYHPGDAPIPYIDSDDELTI